MYLPKISIITATYNNRHTLEDAIRSLLQQTYKNIEYIVIDGASSDGTLEIIKQYRSYIQIFVSEQDNGVYDALNKGLLRATGDVIGFLHADDSFYSPTVLENIASVFASNSITAVYGDLLYVDRLNHQKIIRYWKSQPFKPSLLSKGWMPAHPTFFFQRQTIDEIGLFDTHYHIAADYDYMLRMLLKYPPSNFYYLPIIITCMKVGGKSNRSIRNIVRKMLEDYHIMKQHKIGGTLTLMQKNLSKLTQFLKQQQMTSEK